MQYAKEYAKKLTTPKEAVKIVKSGDWVDYHMGLGMPTLLDAALADRKDELQDVKVRGYLAVKPLKIVEADPEREHFIYNSWHCSGYERKLCDKNLCNYIPMVFRNVPAYYRRYLTVNVAMMEVPPMDDHGYFSFSLNNATARGTMDAADYIILEINENLPRVYGLNDDVIHISEVDAIVEGDHGPLVTLPPVVASPEEEAIAKIVVEEISNGSTVQLGIGGVPNIVGSMIAKSDLKDLGMHTEMLVDAYYEMYKAGNLTNSHKEIHKDKGMFSFCLGSKELYDWAKENPGVYTSPVDYVNEPENIGKFENFVSINNCISVDLYGQTCAETAGSRQISGTGGQLDFLTGAFRSNGGKAFICLTSTFKDKEGNLQSRFTPKFTEGNIVTDPRSQGFMLATEYGLVNLAGRSTWEKAERIISLAHPDHRDGLIEAAEKQKIWIKSNKR